MIRYTRKILYKTARLCDNTPAGTVALTRGTCMTSLAAIGRFLGCLLIAAAAGACTFSQSPASKPTASLYSAKRTIQTPLPPIDFARSPQQLARAETLLQTRSSGAQFDPTKPISIEEWQRLQHATPEQLNAELKKAGSRFLYGPGLGRSATNIGAIAVFPPYAIYLLGNAGLSLAGFHEMYITNFLPDTPRKHVLGFYDGVTSVPGRVAALVAGRKYHE